MGNKYEFTREKIEHEGRTLFRIKAIRDGVWGDAGKLGGYIEKESNLANDEGDAWVYDKAKVFDDARVIDNAKVSWHAIVKGFAVLKDKATASGTTEIL